MNKNLNIRLNSLILFILSLIYILYPYQNISILVYLKPYYFTFILLLGLIFIYIFFVSKSKYILCLLPFYALFIVFLIFLSYSIYYSVNAAESLYAISKYWVYFSIGFVISLLLLFYKRKMILVIINSLFISSTIVALLYYYKFFQLEGLKLLSLRPSMDTIAKIASINVGFGGGRNLLASWEVFSLTFALPLIFSLKSYKKKILYLFLSLLILAIIFLTLSRTAILSLFVFIAIFIFLLKDNKLKAKLIKVNIVMVLSLLLILALNIANIRDFLETRFILAVETLSGKSDTDLGTLGRLELWNYAFKSFIENPILGTGIGTLYEGKKEIGGVHNYHNIFLQILAQTGVIGISIFLFWTFWLVFTSWQNVKFFWKIGDKYFYVVANITFINILIYYFKSLLMFQYFDLEIWTLIGITGGLYVIRKEYKDLCINTSLQ